MSIKSRTAAPMDIVTPERIATLIAFLAVLGAVWLAVRLKGAPLAAHLKSARRMHVAETRALGGGAMAVLLEIDGAPHLVTLSRRGANTVTPLPRAAEARAPAPEAAS
ncbi:hypothetical protein [Roseovarius aquimarinus]|uniref:Flagellar biosynthesis protein, FliO n=1 Tax=Roseovarius aquimarinus TaxID=1229156 RepID=A0ABW7I7A3_9RHOB